ncbi:uncharacterized protein NFIA_023510 [Aspergillus fischeri NRRL 181]|uniref:GPI ethanolamine phosphate transferase 2 n=1 Tax=Neosartorya fischeri (strain ATCC 1020 / DSM 3700 / CBS 544.65 / FGSC A1164 / JCM 1740 / NRRL 181 / WB 181) TaxID=331117 RepID=A1D5E7_NEOFI|nr:conserved hypothetical protein [Aspergillus fischeri NRRL 181]EAW23640.1 conserved hypothetical protein [Aspergillus fischeri NRRL 181]KAG2027571.1 hypothetical protein GB937_000010 [Aspergillus fischeri]
MDVFRRAKMMLLFSNVGIVLGVVVFMAGYFSPPPRLAFENDLEQTGLQGAGEEKRYSQPSAPFDKVVFMVIDALRSDFVYGEDSGFSFTQSLIKSGSAIPFTALAAPPTLTLSRIKAMTQGSGQSFLDAWLNVMHSADARRLVGEDTWLSRFKSERAPEKKMIYYGIDMWCMLYPEIWDRYETVDSFYLPNFSEVDSNVTRGLTSELDKDDWKGLVLHYLGLDNAAHFGGAGSSIVRAKQVEMDDVVRQIYTALEDLPIHANTLFVLAGDHGMTDNGNHGGDTPAEIASALLFISPKFKSLGYTFTSPQPHNPEYIYYSVVDQVDIVPTLGTLLGFSIPAGSVGVVIKQLLALFPDLSQQVRVLMRNARQMVNLLCLKHGLEAPMQLDLCDSACHCGSNRAHRVLCLWERLNFEGSVTAQSEDPNTHDAARLLQEICVDAQQVLGVAHNNLNLRRMATGIGLLTLVVFLLSTLGFRESEQSALHRLMSGAVVLFHGITMFSSRLVEEEHRFWYWTSLAWFGYLGLRWLTAGTSRVGAMFLPLLHVVGQSLNPAGETPWGAGTYLHSFLDDSPLWLWILAAGAHVLAVRTLSEAIGVAVGVGRYASTFGACLVCGLTVLFKICSTHTFNPELLEFLPPWLQSIFSEEVGNLALWSLWSGLLALCIVLLVRHRAGTASVSQAASPAILVGIVELGNVYLRAQARPKSLILFLIFDLQLHCLLSAFSKVQTDASTVSLTVLLLTQSAFFSGGRSNSLASLDMMNGYNGISHTDSMLNVILVSLQTILSNWIGPVWWSLAGLRLLSAATASKSRDSKMRCFLEYLTSQTLYSAFSALAVMASCLWWRDDGVLWTVLAPKYVNVALWAGFHQLLVNGLLGMALWFGVAM